MSDYDSDGYDDYGACGGGYYEDYNDYDDDRYDQYYDDQEDEDEESEEEDEDQYYDYWEEENEADSGDEDHPEAPRRSSYSPEISPAAIRKIIKDAMARENVKEENVPHEGPFLSPQDHKRSKRYFETKGFSWFSCSIKHNRWPSAHSWCFIDLKTQTICFRYKQKCKKCESETTPEFQTESIERMADYVVKQFLIRTGRLQRSFFSGGSTDTTQTQGGPHDEQRCGKCRALGRSCWN